MKFICIGRNYAAHAKELNNAVPDKPVLFLKPDTALLQNNTDFYIPEFSQNIHFECEVIFRVERQGKYIQKEFSISYLNGIGLGIDFTARDLQDTQKAKGLPWEVAKAFNHSAAVSEFLPITDFQDIHNLNFSLFINGELRQKSNTSNMLFSIEDIVAYSSQFFMVKAGDVFFTGTPEGVGQVHPGDHLEAFLENKKLLDFYIH